MNQQWVIESKESEVFTEAFRKSASFFVNYLNPDGSVKADSSTGRMERLDIEGKVYVVSPMLFLKYIIKELLKASGFYIDNDAISDDEDLKKLILYNNFDITDIFFTAGSMLPENLWYDGVTTQSGYVKIVDFVTRQYTGKFKYKDLVPQIQLPEFLLSVQNLLNLCFFFRNDGKVDIIDRETNSHWQSIDLSDYMVGNWQIGEKKDVTLKFSFRTR